MKQSLIIQLALVAISLAVLLYVGLTQDPPTEAPVRITVPFGEGGEMVIEGGGPRRRAEPEAAPETDELEDSAETAPQAEAETEYDATQPAPENTPAPEGT